MSGWWGIPHLSCFNVKLWSNSTNGTELRTNKQTNIRTDERKDENDIPLGINARGIINSSTAVLAHSSFILQGRIQKFWKGGAQNSRVPNHCVPALTPFWISCSCLPSKVCPSFWSTTLHQTIWRYSQNEAIFIILFKTKLFVVLHNV